MVRQGIWLVKATAAAALCGHEILLDIIVAFGEYDESVVGKRSVKPWIYNGRPSSEWSWKIRDAMTSAGKAWMRPWPAPN